MEQKIGVVIIGVKNMKRAVGFYKRIGLKLKFETPVYSEFQTKGAVLALEKRNRVSSWGPVFALSSSNIKKDNEKLKKLNLRFFKQLREESFGFVILPKDSEGNIFEIVQYKK